MTSRAVSGGGPTLVVYSLLFNFATKIDTCYNTTLEIKIMTMITESELKSLKLPTIGDFDFTQVKHGAPVLLPTSIHEKHLVHLTYDVIC